MYTHVYRSIICTRKKILRCQRTNEQIKCQVLLTIEYCSAFKIWKFQLMVHWMNDEDIVLSEMKWLQNVQHHNVTHGVPGEVSHRMLQHGGGLGLGMGAVGNQLVGAVLFCSIRKFWELVVVVCIVCQLIPLNHTLKMVKVISSMCMLLLIYPF